MLFNYFNRLKKKLNHSYLLQCITETETFGTQGDRNVSILMLSIIC